MPDEKISPVLLGNKIFMPITKVIRDYAELDAIYARIPKIACKQKCQECCGPIRISEGEAERIGGVPPVDKNSTCSKLGIFGACSIYNQRPTICRLWGVTENMQCPFGCLPERFLTFAEAKEIMEAVQAWSGPGEMVMSPGDKAQ